MRRISRLALLGALACTFACKEQQGTEVPGESSASRLERVAGGADAPAQPQAGASDQTALPKVRDRDPEQEKKKMSLSKQRSAAAQKLLAAGRLTEAIDHSRQALRIHEQNVDAMLVIAEAYYRQGKYELTLAVTGSALAVDEKIRSPQETSRAHNLQGFAHLKMGNDHAATRAFRAAAEADEKNASAWNNLGTRYLQAGDVETAHACFTYAIELRPTFAKAHLNLGAALRARGKWVEAERAFQKALQLRRNYAEAYFNLGVLYLDADPFPGLDTTKRLEKAIQYLGRYRELALADGPSGPAAQPAGQGLATSSDKTGKRVPRGKPGASPGPAPVSVARADDYIRVAKKGLEREERRMEREKNRQAGGADESTEGEAGASAPAGAGAKTSPSSTDGTGAAAPSGTEAADAPQAPPAQGVQKPGAAPQKPGAAPPSASPSTESKPSTPATPAKPSGEPAPSQPSPPPAQKPSVQKPGQTSAHLRAPWACRGSDAQRGLGCVEKRSGGAWNPLEIADTSVVGSRGRSDFVEVGMVHGDELVSERVSIPVARHASHAEAEVVASASRRTDRDVAIPSSRSMSSSRACTPGVRLHAVLPMPSSVARHPVEPRRDLRTRSLDVDPVTRRSAMTRDCNDADAEAIVRALLHDRSSALALAGRSGSVGRFRGRAEAFPHPVWGEGLHDEAP